MQENLYTIVSALLAVGFLAGLAIGLLLKKRHAAGINCLVRIGPSTVSGRGAFAAEPIRNGDIVERCPALEVTDKDVGGELLNYVFYGSDEHKRLVAMGNGMLFNHSSTPNVAYYREDTGLGAVLILYALRDIAKGEELFYNYGDDWWTTRQ
ncbi:MAG: SET domain-containing protein [Chlorobium sp.]|jgi:SET domain-containing protein|uniref:SET domain-containing protein n=1 Tax=Chlorobium sp. TaxID=1095 RepID=UPI001D95B7A3|nr:SET domain-containing protein [Chlorobium sp.]MBN1279280.1 SET domain-containing protein-lysine N-methyltransferase [Chlorobiaceae bacterium]MCF8216246.1 SET domain-containing protein [Chlorobium sp.]MCF8271148.1 SET domain-containing protein [Chlorobium sp.]MCF8287522.1 SET domain-containing protein [Chlorobium sp.]MCF8291061.1 SET domain-containing protein [Chlorobium sp.]